MDHNNNTMMKEEAQPYLDLFSHDQQQHPDGLTRPSSSSSAPLLLNPAYARTKSLVFDELRNFRVTLRWCALDHSSCSGKLISYSTFLLLTVIVPALTSVSVEAPPNSTSVSFNKLVQLPESALAVISFFTLSAFFRRYGLRQLLFLDALHDDTAYVRDGYQRELDRSFKYMAYILLPCFSIELAHKIVFFSTVVIVPVPLLGVQFPCNSLAFAATLASWVYRTGLFLLVCVLFRLTCELQILRFEGFYKMFEEHASDAAGEIFREHVRIKRQLLLTSHRYRIFIIGCLVVITISQLGALMLVLAPKADKNFCNSGDLVVCSAVQLTGFLMCLLGAARITHRAQRVVSVASRWHMVLSCCPPDCRSSDGAMTKNQIPELMIGEHDDASCCNTAPGLSHASQESPPFGSRQALVMYLQYNGGGITLFGFALDRGMLHALFAFEMTLVLWILSKVVVLS